MAESTRETVATPAISKGYNFASTWEQNAPLTEEQQALVAVLSQTIADTLMSSDLTEESVKLEETNSTAPRSEMHTTIDVVLLNSHQFYKWHADLESAMKSETEEKYRRYVNTLTGHLQTCESILNQVDNTLGLFDDLQMQHQAVAIKTSTLHDACERLVMEKDKLVEFADALRSKLNYFDELENITTQFYAPTMSVANIHFLPLLKRLDECIAYVGNNPQYADSGVYLIKFKQLQSRALGMVRMQVLTVLKGASAQVQAAIKEALGVNGKTSISEVAETSVLYVRFKAAASELKPLMEEIGSRSTKKEYADMLADCHSLYCEQRLSLVQGVIQQRISEYARKEPLPSFARLGCAYLMKVCQSEHQLFDHFFPASSSLAEILNLAALTDPLCTCLYDALRPKFIHEADLDLLCELIDILKGEVLDEQLSRHPELLVCLRPTILRTLADVQERLIFRAQTYMRREVANYLPTQEDIDYPQKLEQVSASADNEEEHEGKDIYDVQYPPLEKTLACLAKLYRCVEPAIFTGLAQESIGVCSVSIQRASKLITKKASQMDGQLFLIKHLLILREQIAPFDMDFAVTHKELDFAHLLEHLRRILRGQASLFDFTSRTSLARTLSPRVLESQVDAKKELEKNLKTTCEQFIMSVTKLIVEPMLSFMTKVTAVKVTKASSLPVDGTKSLKNQAFAVPEKVAEMVSKVDVALKEELPTVVLKMKLYLRNPSTRGILFKPIKSNILEAHDQVLAVINTEYSIEDVNKIHARDQSSLQEYLNSLS